MAKQADLPGASVPATISASRRQLPGSSQTAMIMLFGVIAAMYFAREILIPLAFAFFWGFVLSPLVSLLQKTCIGRVPAVVLTVLVTLVGAVWGGWIIANQLMDVATELPKYRPNIHAKREALRIPTTGPVGLAANSLKDIAREISGPAALHRRLPRLPCRCRS